MREETVKLIKIIDEISHFLLNQNVSGLSFDLAFKDSQAVLTFKHDDCKITEEKLNEMLDILNQDRHPEMESYYWSLAGEYSDDLNLTLINHMVDSADAEIKNGQLVLVLTRSLK